jgi:hypothetical protein
VNVLQHVKVESQHCEWEPNTVSVLQHVEVEAQHCDCTAHGEVGITKREVRGKNEEISKEESAKHIRNAGRGLLVRYF